MGSESRCRKAFGGMRRKQSVGSSAAAIENMQHVGLPATQPLEPWPLSPFWNPCNDHHLPTGQVFGALLPQEGFTT